MHPDDEQDLKAAFAELHRREREPAPSVGAMRQHAMSAAGGRSFSGRHSTTRLLLWGAPATGCVAAVLLWVSGYFSAPIHTQRQTSSAQHVELLLNSIGQQLDVDEEIPSSFYPTDALLTQSDTDLPP